MNTSDVQAFLSYVKTMYSEDTGGGIECDVLILTDGRVLVISEDAIVLYNDLDAWEDNTGEQAGVIYR